MGREFLIPHSAGLIQSLQMSRRRNREQAEAVLLKNIEEHRPERLSELVGMMIDQMLEDLIALEEGKDVELEQL